MTLHVKAFWYKRFRLLPLFWVILNLLNHDVEGFVLLKVNTCHSHIFRHASCVWCVQGSVASHGLLVGHLDVIELINLSKRHFSHDIVLNFVHERVYLFLQFSKALRLVQHRYDQVARRGLDCDWACYEHSNDIVDNVFRVLVLWILKEQTDHVTVIWVGFAAFFFNNSMDKAAKGMTVREVARIDCKDFFLIEALAEHNEWVGFDSSEHIFHKHVHVKANCLLCDYACYKIGVGHSLVGIARADQDADNDVTLHLWCESVQVNYVAIPIALQLFKSCHSALLDWFANRFHLAFEKGARKCLSFLFILWVIAVHPYNVVVKKWALSGPIELVLVVEGVLGNVELFKAIARVEQNHRHA